MSKKEKDIELIPWPMENSGWKVKHDGKEGSGPGPENYPKLKYDKDSGPHLMVFKLPTSGNTKFNPDHPIAIVKGTESPDPKAGVDPQFPDWAIFDGGKTLVVLNSNSGTAGQYTYTVKADNYAKVLDPIVDNGGGVGGVIDPPPIGPGSNGGFNFAESLVPLSLAFLAGVVLTLIIKHFWR